MSRKTPGRTGARELRTRVKTARGRTVSSTQWLQRQLNDPYVARARAEGRRSRAAYKLLELNEKFRLIRPGMRIVDLGSAPGGWSQVITEIAGADEKNPKIVAIDCLDMEPIAGVIFVKKDFNDANAPAAILDALGGHKADLVLSDMAAPAVGHRPTDHLRIIALAELAAHFALEVLAPRGAFVAKVLQGGTERDLLVLLKQNFEKVQHAKPPASRQGSAETYMVARGFKG
ncbi:MAG: RlmE family RNA methyltransferase [Alphaproteobacteria bacterium]|nr:RlmE family RNA methyltransferase [Alphaproteobacteria bacterium]